MKWPHKKFLKFRELFLKRFGVSIISSILYLVAWLVSLILILLFCFRNYLFQWFVYLFVFIVDIIFLRTKVKDGELLKGITEQASSVANVVSLA